MRQSDTIRTMRLAGGMTQQELADAARVSVRTVARAETHRPIHEESVRSICSVLGLDAESFCAPQPVPTAPVVDAAPSASEPTAEPSARSWTARVRAATGCLVRWPAALAGRGPVLAVAGALAMAPVIAASWSLRGGVMDRDSAVAFFRPESADRVSSVVLRDARGDERFREHASIRDVSAFAARVIGVTYIWNFSGWRTSFQEAAVFYEPSGWREIEDSFSSLGSGLLGTVLDGHMAIAGTVVVPPVVTDQGYVDGHYAWKIEAPFLVSYRPSKPPADWRNLTEKTQALMGRMVVEMDSGRLAISHMVVR